MTQIIKSCNLLPVTLCLLLFTACHNDDDSLSQSHIPEDGMIRVTTTVSNTRAGITTEKLSSFNLNIKHPTDSRYSYYAIMRKNNNSWKSHVNGTSPTAPELPLLWKNGHDKITVGAIHTQGDLAEESDFDKLKYYSVQTRQNKEYSVSQSDILYMPPTEVDPATGKGLIDGKVKVVLDHLFCKFNLNITLGTEYNVNPGTAINPITDVAINGTKAHVYFNAATNAWGNLYDNAQSITPLYIANEYLPGQGETQKAQASYECILIPQSVATMVFNINFTIGGREFLWTSKKNITLESGKQYNLSLNVGKDITIIGDMTASDWENGTGGELETE